MNKIKKELKLQNCLICYKHRVRGLEVQTETVKM